MKSKTRKAAGKASLDGLVGLLGKTVSVYAVLHPRVELRMPYVLINGLDPRVLSRICARLNRLRKQANEKVRRDSAAPERTP